MSFFTILILLFFSSSVLIVKNTILYKFFSSKKLLKYKNNTIYLIISLHLFAFIAIVYFIPVNWTSLSQLWLHDGKLFENGLMPYRDFIFEYPPLAIILFWIPAHFTNNINLYRTDFMLEELTFDIIFVITAVWMAKKIKISPLPWLIGIMLLQPVWLIIAGRNLIFEDFDLISSVLVFIAIILFVIKRYRSLSWIALGLATALKLYPIIIAPIFFLLSYSRETHKQKIINITLFIITVILPIIIITKGDITSFYTFFNFHFSRGVEIESVYASLNMFSHFFGANIVHITGKSSEEILGPLNGFSSIIAIPLTMISLLIVYFYTWKVSRKLHKPVLLLHVLLCLSSCSILIFMMCGKVLSPQFFIWLYPLIASIIYERKLIWITYGLLLLINTWIYPLHWIELNSLTTLSMTVLIFRNLLSIILCALIIRCGIKAISSFSSVN